MGRPLPTDIAKDFQNWLSELEKIQEIKIPRFYGCAKLDKQLHIFADASELAMCIVVYIRFPTDTGFDVKFVMGKTRVCPMKPVSIPRLELQAALHAARIKSSVQEEHNLNFAETYMRSDSKTVLQWLKTSDKKHPIFVANRVAEILENTTIDQWHHVAGVNNPADLGTRGLKAEELSAGPWLDGPNWLRLERDEWFSDDNKVASSRSSHDEDSVVWVSLRTCFHSDIECEVENKENNGLGKTCERSIRPGLSEVKCFVNIKSSSDQQINWFNMHKYRSWTKIVNIFCYVLRVFKIKPARVQITVEEFESAERQLFKHMQSEMFSEEITRLQNGQRQIQILRQLFALVQVLF